MSRVFQHKHYLFQRKILGSELHVYDNSSNVVFYLRQKPFSLKKDFRVYADENMNRELLVIKIPIFTLWSTSTYNIEEPIIGKKIGSIVRWAWKGNYEYIFSSLDGQEMGKLITTRVSFSLKQRHIIRDNEQEIAEIEPYYNPFIPRCSLRIISPESNIDVRLLIAAGILFVQLELGLDNVFRSF